jgi:hypothetical protein
MLGKRKSPEGIRIRTDRLKSDQVRYRAYVGKVCVGVFDTLKEAEAAGVKRLAEMVGKGESP